MVRASGGGASRNDGAPRDLLFVALERHPRLRANPNLRVNRNVDWLNIHGRLDTGVDIAQANVTLAATMSDLSKLEPLIYVAAASLALFVTLVAGLQPPAARHQSNR